MSTTPSRWASLPRSKRLTGKPPTNEERVIAALERYFPGSEWVDCPLATSEVSDATPSGGTGTPPLYYVVVGSEYDKKLVRRWAEDLPQDAKVMCGSPRYSKAGVPLNGEALIFDIIPRAAELPWGEDYLGKNFRYLQAGLIATKAQVDRATLVLIGRGRKIDAAKSVVDHLGKHAPATVVVD
ncbi:MAG: hypothetical protein KatS3mg015_2842 [Fimbriimonadales bacterium]|nr:MAG: hypothetical protein KatS3mg015_2842 [Fimbriimonadales bacterium]